MSEPIESRLDQTQKIQWLTEQKLRHQGLWREYGDGFDPVAEFEAWKAWYDEQEAALRQLRQRGQSRRLLSPEELLEEDRAAQEKHEARLAEIDRTNQRLERMNQRKDEERERLYERIEELEEKVNYLMGRLGDKP